MEKPTEPALRHASDFPPEVLRLFDQYVHNVIDRRAFLDRATAFATKTVTAAAFLEALRPRFAEAQQIKPTDARLRTETVDFASPRGYGKARGYLARPVKAAGKLPTVLVAHENRGLNPHIEDIARRLALDGFLAFAPDALAPLGGYPGHEDNAEDEARAAFATLDQAKTREDFVAAAAFARARPESNGHLGVVGFCWGGGIANFLATRLPDLSAAVPFYGMAPATETVPAIKAPLLLHFAEHDDRINASWPAYEAALKAAHVRYEAHVYPGTQHGFNNDTTPRYDAAAATLAWQRTIAFFHHHLEKV
ncbi:MAG TPA: dienelactone hydrolase family protein [Polyangia bacterium]|nr:dienelactone hydrolase family protein [Polyangia bacterium]